MGRSYSFFYYLPIHSRPLSYVSCSDSVSLDDVFHQAWQALKPTKIMFTINLSDHN